MPGVGNRAASFAGVFRPLIAERSGSGPTIFPAEPKPKWDVHLPGVGNRAASFAGVFRPLIAERSGSGPHLIFPADQSGKEAADSLRHRLPAPQAKVPRRLRSRPSPDRLITVEVRCQGRRQEKASRRPENRLAERRATWPIIAVIEPSSLSRKRPFTGLSHN